MSYNNELNVLIQKINKIEDCHPLLDYYDLKYRTNTKDYSMPCPLPNHHDSAPSFFINHHGLYYCHGCNEKGNLITLAREIEGIGFKEAVHRVARIFRLTSEVTMNDINQALKQFSRNRFQKLAPLEEVQLPKESKPALDFYDIVKKRVTRAQIKKYDMRFCDTGIYKDSLIIPITFNNKVVAYFARDFSGNSDRPKRYNSGAPSKRIFFNYDHAVKNSQYVVVTEGIFDALKLQFYGYNVIACLGTNLSTEKIHLLIKNWEKVYISLDNDRKVDANGKVYNPGQEAAKKWAEKLKDEMIVRNILLPTGQDPDETSKPDFDKAFYEARVV